MTDKEYIEQIPNMPFRDLVEDCIRFANDGYYKDLFYPLYDELQKRFKESEENK